MAVELPDNALCTIGEVERAIGLTTGEYDDEIAELLEAVCEEIEAYCGQRLRYRGSAITEYIDVDVQRRDIWTAHRPIVTVTTVHEDPNRDHDSSTLLTVDEDYLIYTDEGRIRRIDQNWQHGDKVVKVVYTHGYSTLADVPSDLRRAAVRACEFEWSKVKPGQNTQRLASKSKGDGSVTYLDDWPENLTRKLDRYMHNDQLLVGIG